MAEGDAGPDTAGVIAMPALADDEADVVCVAESEDEVLGR
jgi:hypothetical protein